MTIHLPRKELEAFAKSLVEKDRRRQRIEQSGEGGLYKFVQHFWHILEPETPMVPGWPMEAICEHLEAVTRGEINRLLINVFPGAAKSLLVNVFWPAWEWGPMDMAHLRYVTFSYSARLTMRDNGRFRDLVVSPEYQALWGHRVKVDLQGNAKISNHKKGWKLASSVGGVGTGERGDRILLDDPHNVKEGESDIVRGETVRWFREAMQNRLNDQDAGVIVVIMQRVHEDDVSGAILSTGMEYCHLLIQMEYDPAFAFDDDGTVKSNAIGWVDPRLDEDDLDGCNGLPAWPARFPAHVIAGLKRDLGPYAWHAQYEQAPAPRGGGIFKTDWWQLWAPKDGKFPVFEYIIASLDSAFTEDQQNDPSGLTVWGIFLNSEGRRRIMLVNAWRKHLQFSGPRVQPLKNENQRTYLERVQPEWGLVEWVAHTCGRFKVDKLLIEAKASGISAAQELRNRYGRQDWSIHLCATKGDKVARALAVQATFAQGLIYAPSRDWADLVIEEMGVFPKGKYKDLTDSATQAIKHLRDNGMAETDDEFAFAENQRATHKPQRGVLYPC